MEGSQKVERALRKLELKRAKGKPKVRGYQDKKTENCLYVVGCWRTGLAGPAGQKEAKGPVGQKGDKDLARQEAVEGRETLLIVLPYERLKPKMN